MSSKQGTPDSEINAWLEKLEKLYGERRAKAFEEEQKVLSLYLHELRSELSRRGGLCRLVEPMAVGGTGVVFKAAHSNLPKWDLVVKFNRPLISDDEMSMVENERRVLPQLNHANIIQVLDVGTIKIPSRKPSLSFIIEPLIRDSKPLGRYDEEREYHGYIIDIARSCCPPRASVDTAALSDVLERLDRVLCQWASALRYIHQKGHLYLDVKPENVIVDKNGHLQIIDFGSAQKMDENDENSLRVYYSEPYADPWLKKQEEARTSGNRIRGAVKRKDLKRELDYYALGKSILEMLSEIAKVRAHDFPQIPSYRSLHLLATRLLNGKNDEAQLPSADYVAGETFGGLRQADYRTIKYRDLDEVIRDLGKDDGSWNPEMIVPELATYSRDIIRVIQGANTDLSARLLALMEHPTFARLKLVTQLGLISLVYPTADHSRFDHILGTYTYTASYVKSLFNDAQNPLFRNLVDDHDIKSVLLAALLHDLGQYPLAHDLEEVQPRIFDHTRISLDLIESDQIRNRDQLTIRDIVSKEDDPSCWGVKIDSLKRILRARSPYTASEWLKETDVSDFKVQLLSALIDGPIDADKADYIIRDSEECRVPYGRQLDIERLLRVLTCAIYQDTSDPTGPHKVTVGVYQKGKASADSFSLSRYVLFASVYWHHTCRILKAMLQYATALALPSEALMPTGGDERIRQVREQLMDFIKRLTPPFDIGPGQKGSATRRAESYVQQPTLDIIQDARFRTAAKASGRWYPGIAYADWQMLRWIQELPSSTGVTGKAADEAVALIDCILRRDLYKRVYALPRSDEEEGLRKNLVRLLWPQRIKLSRNLHLTVRGILKKQRPDTGLESFEKIDEIFDSNLAILVDIPDPEKKIGFDRPLLYLPELTKKTYYQTGEEPVMAKQLKDSMEQLMTSISPVRIVCHPELRKLIRRYIPPKEITKMVESALGQV